MERRPADGRAGAEHHAVDVGRLCRGIDKVRPFITALDWTPGGLTDDLGLRAKVVSKQLELF